MRLYNTLTRRIEEFKPLHDKTVMFYQCGPTVYWTQHIGNLRAMVWADLIRRILLYLGYKVKFARNYTDVGHLTSDSDEGEDKMEKGARREKLTPKDIADKYIKIFEMDTNNLNILTPDYIPRATKYISQMIDMIKILIDKGFAYITDLAIYFDVSKFRNYNELNKQKVDLNIPGSGKGKIEDPKKRHFADFALWFFKKGAHENAIQTWLSPWGVGFPGWHIECSVMAKTLLGDTIDIHMGGIEHISIHHTNEIAQSEGANGVKFVNFWLHNEHLTVNGKKMAKSEGTSITLKEVIEKGYDALDLRYFFLNAHYRTRQNFTWESLSAAKEGFRKLKEFVLILRKQTDRSILSEDKLKQLDVYRQKFVEYVSNDFQIPQALALSFEMLKSNIPSLDKLDLLYEFDEIFGLNLRHLENEIVPEEIKSLAEKRYIARSNNDFKTADKVRKLIEEKGYTIEDRDNGFSIKKIH
ncbi:MAG: cysteine--tRNA ligase [Actinobacteria bacterium]|nr:cysteine--tRNA ligase [Actinomycetota bacterium]